MSSLNDDPENNHLPKAHAYHAENVLSPYDKTFLGNYLTQKGYISFFSKLIIAELQNQLGLL